LEEVGVAGNVEAHVLRLAGREREVGLDGCVASPRQIRLVRRGRGPRWTIGAPGIRPADRSDDQKRVATAAAAIRAGADAIVVGRPITAVPDPKAAASAILSEIAYACGPETAPQTDRPKGATPPPVAHGPPTHHPR